MDSTLYLSRYIIQNKSEYYRLLQEVRDKNNWEGWVLFMLEAVISVSQQSIKLIGSIKKEMLFYKHVIRNNYPKIYSQDLLNNIFKHPYTKIEFLQNDLSISRQTAAKYLDILTNDENKILEKIKIGRDNFYINTRLMTLFTQYDYRL